MNGVAYHQTQSQIFVKGIDYFGEEYVKQLLQAYDHKKTEAVYPYVGTIYYPSDDFLNQHLALEQTRQFAAMTYIGYMDMLLPKPTTIQSPVMSINIVTFKLDGRHRQYMTVCQPNTKDNANMTFLDFALALYPDANNHLPFNRSAIHVLSEISLTGSAYQITSSGQGYEPIPGNYTPTIEFDIAVSGYQAKQT